MIKEKFLVLWSSSDCKDPLQTTLDNLNQVRGALSVIDDVKGLLFSVTRTVVND